METIDDSLQGLRVLVVEDETLVAMLVEDYLTEIGCTVTASVRRTDKALEVIASKELDAAVLDVNVAGTDVSPVAEALSEQNIPFIFASGYGGNGIQARWADRPIIQKPFTSSELKHALARAMRDRQN